MCKLEVKVENDTCDRFLDVYAMHDEFLGQRCHL